MGDRDVAHFENAKLQKCETSKSFRRTKPSPISRSTVPTVKAIGWPAVFAISPTSVRRAAPSVGALIVPATGRKYELLSRRDPRPSCANHEERQSDQAIRSEPKRSVQFYFAGPSNFVSNSLPARKKEAERRQTCRPTSASCDAARVRAARARLSAFHHGSCCSERTPQLSSRYALPRTWSGARPRWFERPCASQRMIERIVRH